MQSPIAPPRSPRPRQLRWSRSLVVVALALVFAPLASTQALAKSSWQGVLSDHKLPQPPWPRRSSVRPNPAMAMFPMAAPNAYGPEPSAPSAIDRERFANALEQLCGTKTKLRRAHSAISHETAIQLTTHVLRWSKHFKVDPFVVSALVFRRSRCRARVHRRGLVGLGRIDVASHELHIRSGFYTYFVLDGDNTWQPRTLDVRLFRFSRRSLLRPSANIYFTAALLAVSGLQAPSLERAVKQVPHRHYVSHFVWGDRVRSSRNEELILQARRRMLRLYRADTPRPRARCRGIALQSPLDGYPRKISSGHRAWRVVAGRRRRHNGVDFVSTYGEPVRAAADGTVVFAGAHVRGGGWLLPPERARKVRSRSMISGLFVTLRHGRGVRTRYFHLSGYTVRTGQYVKAGQIIGWVGRTGIKQSAPHLHFEIHHWGRRLNPAYYLRPYLLPPHGKGLRRRRGYATRHLSVL